MHRVMEADPNRFAAEPRMLNSLSLYDTGSKTSYAANQRAEMDIPLKTEIVRTGSQGYTVVYSCSACHSSLQTIRPHDQWIHVGSTRSLRRDQGSK